MIDLMLTESEKMLQNMVRDFAEREVMPRSAELDEKAEFSWDNWRGMARLGLAGVGVDPAYGGSGGGFRQSSIAISEIARADAAASVSLAAHLGLGLETIARFGNEEQKQQYLPSLASGDGIAAWALTEPGSGSDAAAMATVAARRNGYWVLNGSKQFITNAEVAETLVVFANQDRSAGYRGVCAFIVPAGTPGMQINPQHNKMGIRASSTCEIVFEDAEIPADNIIGEPGMGFRYAMDILDSSRISIAAQCVGIGQAALEEAVRYAQLRESFGRPLAQHQAIQFKLADIAAAVHSARIATMHAATLRDQGLPFINEASMAKLLASEMCNNAAYEAMQIHGGIGYFKESRIERIFRDARVTTIYEGTSEVQRMIIARQVLAQYPV